MAEQTVLVTGAAGRWGSRLVRHLSKRHGYRLIGLDLRDPQQQFEGVRFVRADLTNPQLVELLRTERVDTVVHLVFASGLEPGSPRLSSEEAFQINVMGTHEVLAACYASNVRQVVLKSSTIVYGAQVDNPLYLREQAPLRARRSAMPNLRDRLEIESAVDAFRQRHRRPAIAILRFPGILGPTIRSSLARYLAQPAPPTLLGFDPLYQIIHEDDVVAALAHVVEHGGDGPYNIAADGVLALSQLIRRCGRQPLPVAHPLASWLQRLLPGGRQQVIRELLPFDADYLRYPWIVDTRRMREELQFEPRYTADETIQAFASALRLRPFADIIERRRQAARQFQKHEGPDDDDTIAIAGEQNGDQSLPEPLPFQQEEQS